MPSVADARSTPVCRYAPPLFPMSASWYASPSGPLSNASASIVPGTGAGVPLNGVDDPDAGFGTIVLSPVTGPGALERYMDGLSTIWSICTPSSRVWTRILRVPVVANLTIRGWVSQYAVSCHPQPDTPQPLQFSRFTSSALVVPMR